MKQTKQNYIHAMVNAFYTNRENMIKKAIAEHGYNIECLEVRQDDNTTEFRVCKVLSSDCGINNQTQIKPLEDEIVKIGKLIETQDNRITDQPVFVIETIEKVPIDNDEYGYDERGWYNVAKDIYINENQCDIDYLTDIFDEEFEASGQSWQEFLDSKREWEKVYFHYTWVFETFCFTEQGCKDYLQAYGDKLGRSRIYVYGSYRNFEYQEIRNHLLSLTSNPNSTVSYPDIVETGNLIQLHESEKSHANLIYVIEKAKKVVTSEGFDYDGCEWFCSQYDFTIDDDEDDFNYLQDMFEDLEEDGQSWQELAEASDEWEKFYFKYVWVYSLACFTKEGCDNYVRSYGYNLGKHRITSYDISGNDELMSVRNYLLTLASNHDKAKL